MMLFLSGFSVVFCVTVQTWFIAQSYLPRIAVVGFLISFIWSFNVKRIAFGGMSDRIIYSLGASAGAVAGMLAGKGML
jgi:hypothetical protein